MTRKNAISLILFLLAAILGVVGYKLASLRAIKAGLTLPVSACDPALGDCTATLPGGGKIELSFSPRPIRPLQAFEARLTVRDAEVRSAEIDFEGTTMKMGYHRPRFDLVNGSYRAEAILPVCLTGTMQWTATVLLDTPAQTIAIPFHFEVLGH
ncbi:MAG: hypothetical protein QM739_15260 [Propionivibrio sp.]